jgi:hypothetical protein
MERFSETLLSIVLIPFIKVGTISFWIFFYIAVIYLMLKQLCITAVNKCRKLSKRNV